jgi:hypothetical protein
LVPCVERGGWQRALALGVWCGLGLWVDSLFLLTLAGLIPAAIGAWWTSGQSRIGLLAAAAFVAGLAVGVAPRQLGARFDPYDAYREQFAFVATPELVGEHTQILARDCLPRLIVGHRLPGLEADPDPAALAGPGPTSRMIDHHPLAIAATVAGLALFLGAAASLMTSGADAETPAAAAVRRGLLLSTAAAFVGFIINKNIFNADNYRYLVQILIPWAVGFGLLMHRLGRQTRGGRAVALACAAALAALMTVDTARWYTRFGWVDPRGNPTRRAVADPALAWLNAHPEVTAFSGGYWDVYRLSFLASTRVRGIPYPIYPNRFPEWSASLAGRHPGFMLVKPSREGQAFLARALGDGGRVVHRERGLIVATWP